MLVLVTSLEIQRKKFLRKLNCNKIIMKVPWATTYRAAQSIHGCRIGGALSMWDYNADLGLQLEIAMLPKDMHAKRVLQTLKAYMQVHCSCYIAENADFFCPYPTGTHAFSLADQKKVVHPFLPSFLQFLYIIEIVLILKQLKYCSLDMKQ